MHQTRGPLGAAPVATGTDRAAGSGGRGWIASVLVALPLFVAFLVSVLVTLMLVQLAGLDGKMGPSGPGASRCFWTGLILWVGLGGCTVLTCFGAAKGFGGKSGWWSLAAVLASIAGLAWSMSFAMLLVIMR